MDPREYSNSGKVKLNKMNRSEKKRSYSMKDIYAYSPLELQYKASLIKLLDFIHRACHID